MGVYKTGNGVYFINPQLGLFTIKGSQSTANICTPGQTTPCFSEPAPGQYGNLPYDGFSGPHFFDQDLSMSKETVLWERLHFRVALEAFDVFNNANFALRKAPLDLYTETRRRTPLPSGKLSLDLRYRSRRRRHLAHRPVVDEVYLLIERELQSGLG